MPNNALAVLPISKNTKLKIYKEKMPLKGA
jgi:hypothetical protein